MGYELKNLLLKATKCWKNIICIIFIAEIELDFAVPLRDVTVPEKRQARFECQLTREANVIWSKGSDIIKVGEKFDIIADGKKHILVINDSQFDDEGEYTAEVEGKKTTAKLFVEGKFIKCEELCCKNCKANYVISFNSKTSQGLSLQREKVKGSLVPSTIALKWRDGKINIIHFVYRTKQLWAQS